MPCSRFVLASEVRIMPNDALRIYDETSLTSTRVRPTGTCGTCKACRTKKVIIGPSFATRLLYHRLTAECNCRSAAMGRNLFAVIAVHETDSASTRKMGERPPHEPGPQRQNRCRNKLRSSESSCCVERPLAILPFPMAASMPFYWSSHISTHSRTLL